MKLFKYFFTITTCLTMIISCGSFVLNAAEPSVSAKSAVVMEASQGIVIYEKNAHEKLPMASTTKIMTALCAIENGDLSEKVKISSTVCGVEGSSIYLKSGEELTLEELLYAVMLESANDAATAVAVEISGSVEKFAELMNETAAKIGASDTHFTNPHGLDNEEHYTTAEDLARIASYALKNETFRQIVSTHKKTIPLYSGEGVRMLLNHNKMLKLYDGAIGVKTGFTKRSGRCLVSAAEKDGLTVVAVTLSAPNDWKDHTAMLNYGFDLYEMKSVANSGQFRYQIPVTGGNASSIWCSNKDSVSIPMKKESENISYTAEIDRFLFAPVGEGDVIGKVTIKNEDTVIDTVPLYAESTVSALEKPGFLKSIINKIAG